MSFTVVEYYGKQNNSGCGYCKRKKSSHSHGMHAYIMTAQDYQDLIDRGWRRSGLYCYKPNNKITCCPSYTIKCNTQEFKLSKSHKKILRRMNKFLTDGIREKDDISQKSEECDTGGKDEGGGGNDNDDGDGGITSSSSAPIREEPEIPNIEPRNINISEIKKSTNRDGDKKEQIEVEGTEAIDGGKTTKIDIDSSSSQKEIKKGVGPSDFQKAPCKKAKELRLERKKQKLEAKGILLEDFMKTKKENQQKKNQEKSLKDYICDIPENGSHKLKVILIPSNKGVTTEVIDLYRKYQVAVHKDPPQKITKSSFERFLVKSPLQIKLVDVNSDEFNSTLKFSYGLYVKYQTHIHNDPPDNVQDYLCFLQRSPLKNKKTSDGPSEGYGSFHQQYWLDDKLIAVGVIDILPYCVSSVYFFYDPDYNFLSLGTYGSLREIDFTRQLSEQVPSLKYYYMGFYIHSCPKMRYKGKLVPSYLLCPEVYTWHLLTDEIKGKLDQNKYQRFNDDPNAKDENEFTENDLDSVLLLVNETTYLTYGQYKESFNLESVEQMLDYIRRTIYSEVVSGDHRANSILEYGQLVGKKCAHRMLFVH